MVEENEDLGNNLAAAAHLVHGSFEGRFSITCCPGKGEENLTRPDGEEIFYISNPALGLWAFKDKFEY